MAATTRAFNCLAETNFLLLCKELVRNQLDYGASVCSPYKRKIQVDVIENVYRRATKQLPGMKDLLECPARLKRPALFTLAYRRVPRDMVEAYELLHGMFNREVVNVLTLCKDAAGMDYLHYTNWVVYIRGVTVSYCSNPGRQNSFAHCIVPLWNNLPVEVDNWSRSESETKAPLSLENVRKPL